MHWTYSVQRQCRLLRHSVLLVDMFGRYLHFRLNMRNKSARFNFGNISPEFGKTLKLNIKGFCWQILDRRVKRYCTVQYIAYNHCIVSYITNKSVIICVYEMWIISSCVCVGARCVCVCVCVWLSSVLLWCCGRIFVKFYFRRVVLRTRNNN